MTPEEQRISRIEEELDGARRDLHETLSAVQEKVELQVERAEIALRPRRLLKHNLGGVSLAVGLAGFMLGSSRYRKLTRPLVLVAFGYAIWSGYLIHGSDDDGGASADS